MPVYISSRHPHLKVSVKNLAALLRGQLRQLGRGRATVDVSLVDDGEIRTLNKQWRRKNAVTDVLSFALTEAAGPDQSAQLLGDIVISLDTAARQAEQMRAQFGLADYGLWHETAFLATHGLLHLLGHDHQTAADADQMQALERQLIAPVTTAPVHDLDRRQHGL